MDFSKMNGFDPRIGFIMKLIVFLRLLELQALPIVKPYRMQN
jgi:hypothetical protein